MKSTKLQCCYEKPAYLLHPGDILAIKGHSPVSAAIKNLTKSPYSHIAIVGRDELHVFEALWSGIRYREIRNQFGKFDVFRYPNLTCEEINCIIAFCSKRINLGYDFMELFSYIFHGLQKLNNPNKYICSQLACDAYEGAGISLCPPAQKIHTPGDITKSKQLIKIN